MRTRRDVTRSTARTVEASFCLGEEMQADGTHRERRSDYMTFRLDAR